MARLTHPLVMVGLATLLALPGILVLGSPANAQLTATRTLSDDEADKIKAEIKELVAQRLAQQRDEMMRDIDRILTQAMKQRAAGDSQLQRAERRIAELEKVIADLRAELGHRRGAEGEGEHGESAERAGGGERGASDAILGFAFRPGEGGLQVTMVLDGSPAAKVLKEGDLITGIDGKAVDQEGFLAHMGTKKPGDKVSLAYQRRVDGRVRKMEANPTLVSRTDFQRAIERLADEGARGDAERAAQAAAEAERKAAEAARRAAEERQAAERAAGPVRLGLTVREDDFKLVVTEVVPGSNAAEAGIRPEDELVALDGRQVKTLDGIKDVLNQLRVGRETTIGVRRGESEIVATLVLGGGDRKPVLKSSRVVDGRGDQLKEPETAKKPGFLGIQIDMEKEGIHVAGVEPGSAAEAMGLKAGDIVTSINGSEISGLDSLRAALGKLSAGDRIRVRVKRGDGNENMRGRLGARPDDGEPQAAAPRREAPIVATAIKKPAVEKPVIKKPAGPGGLGVVAVQQGDRVLIDEILAGSSAGTAGLRSGDAIVKAAGQEIDGFSALRKVLAGRSAGDLLELTVEREGATRTLSVPLTAVDRDQKPATTPAPQKTASGVAVKPKTAEKKPSKVVLGVTLEELIDEGRILVRAVEDGGPAQAAGLKVGDELLKMGGRDVSSLDTVRDLLAERRPGDQLKFRVKRDGKDVTVAVTLGS